MDLTTTNYKSVVYEVGKAVLKEYGGPQQYLEAKVQENFAEFSSFLDTAYPLRMDLKYATTIPNNTSEKVCVHLKDLGSLGSIGIGDAYLQVEQDEPTIVEVDDSWYELGYTLPGQRTGSSAWFNKLQGIAEKHGLKSDDGLPALFYRLPKDGEPGIITLSHVDDLEVFATKRGFEDLVKKLKAEGLKMKFEGPLERNHGSTGFLKRTLQPHLKELRLR